jgi:hypothetical protein
MVYPPFPGGFTRLRRGLPAIVLEGLSAISVADLRAIVLEGLSAISVVGRFR